MTQSINIPLKLPLGLRLRLMAARLMATAGFDAGNRAEAERRFMKITSNQGNLVASICLSFAKSKEEFEDLRQDSLINIWRGIENFRGESGISTWVYRITLNTCVSSQRKKQDRQETYNEFYHDLFDDSSAEDVERYKLMYCHVSSDCQSSDSRPIRTADVA